MTAVNSMRLKDNNSKKNKNNKDNNNNFIDHHAFACSRSKLITPKKFQNDAHVNTFKADP